MITDVDLGAYLRRIDWTGSPSPNLETLRCLIEKHCATIPYENIDPLLGVAVDLEPSKVERKLVGQHRGGYCFEHNTLFASVLEQIGFDVVRLAARTLWGGQPDAIPLRGHMALLVTVAGIPWVADVGFGGMTVTAPLRLDRLDSEQQTPHGTFRVIRVDDDYVVQASIAGAWHSTYRFDLTSQRPIDFIAPNWYTATHPSSVFVNGLLVARAASDRRFALGNRHLSTYHLDGNVERRTLESSTELINALVDNFFIELENSAPLERAFDGLP